jgi:phosphoglycolate phosphatase
LDLKNSCKWKIEIIKSQLKRGNFKSALFDFDGTISLIRQGWREVMVPYFVDKLLLAPGDEDEKSIRRLVENFVDFLTGKQTIYQCMRLDEEVQRRGGKHVDPLEYKKEYHKMLMDKIKHRLAGLDSGKIDPQDLLVPGSLEFIKSLSGLGLTLYLASGTDEDYVLREAELLGIVKFFDGGIYGAKDKYKLFSKSMVIRKILDTHGLNGHELLGFGDGYIEIENIKDVGGFAVGLATNEEERKGINEWKRGRLIKAGADIIIPDFREVKIIEDYLFNKRVDINAV